MKTPNPEDPHNIIGKEVPAADGGNYGHRVLSFDWSKGDYIVEAIRWSTGERLGENSQPKRIDWFKISYRYSIKKARKTNEHTDPRNCDGGIKMITKEELEVLAKGWNNLASACEEEYDKNDCSDMKHYELIGMSAAFRNCAARLLLEIEIKFK